ncbi:formate dehydrogenase subunit gamma [Actinomadura alba]|uniref:Formate dehydrogenase subunit gamma n=1 Tax=Actinomadura alba TaxID=406431 RepID=A0ABR7LHA3_9ACTN|nr:formate dehydrogenase subunit gamma [Actinomadura alba]
MTVGHSLSIEDRVRAIVTAHDGERGRLLPILHGIQAEFGYVDEAVVPVLAQELNISRADVHGVITFYHDFRKAPAGRTEVRVCRGEACQAVGAENLMAHAQRRLGVSTGETTPGGDVTLEQVFCLGNCALGPSVQVNGRLYGRVGTERLDTLMAEADAR